MAKPNPLTLRVVLDSAESLENYEIINVNVNGYDIGFNFLNNPKQKAINLSAAIVSQRQEQVHQRIGLIAGAIGIGLIIMVLAILSRWFKKRRHKQELEQTTNQEKPKASLDKEQENK